MSVYGSGLYGAGVYAGPFPNAVVYYTTGEASDPSPTWIRVDNDLIRALSTSRGRENERQLVDAGTATLTITNRDRTFDPVVNPLIRPMNRWKIQVEVNGVEDIFVGYAESYQQGWPATGKDAIVTVSCVDEMKVLAMDALTPSDPPRSTYREVAIFDSPVGYWPMDNPAGGLQQLSLGGGGAFGGDVLTSVVGAGAIVGEPIGGYVILLSPYQVGALLQPGDAGDAGGLPAFTVEGFFNLGVALPTATWPIVSGPLSNSVSTYVLAMNTSGQFVGTVRNSGGTLHTVTSTTAAAADQTFYHVVLTITDNFVRLYVDGVEEDSVAWTGTIGDMDADQSFVLGTSSGTGTGQIGVDELAFYRIGLPADRVAAHVAAGFNRGYDNQVVEDRIISVLNDSTSVAPYSINSSPREMTPVYVGNGAGVLEELRRAELAESGTSVLFIAKDGTITFLQDAYRGIPPWDTVQATFDDDGTDLQYLDVQVDYSESFLWNEVVVTGEQSSTITASDATSQSRYMKRTLSISGIPTTSHSVLQDIADGLIAKYKDPMTRVTGLTLTTAHTGITETVFGLEIGDPIRVFRSPPGGGTRIDQTVYIQRIQVDATAQSPYWRIVLNVSPL